MSGVVTKWCVLDGARQHCKVTDDFAARHTAQTWAKNFKHGIVAKVTYDSRNWETVDASHPLTQADNGRAVQVGGLELGVIDDAHIGSAGCVLLRCGDALNSFALESITHVVRPHTPLRKNIIWSYTGSWMVGRVAAEIVAAAVYVAATGGVFVMAVRDRKPYSRRFATKGLAIDVENPPEELCEVWRWCDYVVNGDKEEGVAD